MVAALSSRLKSLEARYAESEKQVRGLKDATVKLNAELSSFMGGTRSQLAGVRDWLDQSIDREERQDALHTREVSILEDVSRKMDLYQANQWTLDAKYDALVASVETLKNSHSVPSSSFTRERYPALWNYVSGRVDDSVDSLLQDINLMGGLRDALGIAGAPEVEPYQQADNLSPHAGSDDKDEDKMDQDDPDPSRPGVNEGHQPTEDVQDVSAAHDHDPLAPAGRDIPARNILSSQALSVASRPTSQTPTSRLQQGKHAENDDEVDTSPVNSPYLHNTYHVLILPSLGHVKQCGSTTVCRARR